MAQGSGGTAGLWDHSPGFQFWPSGAPRETHARTKSEDDFQREGFFTGALQCRPQPTEPRPASPGCQVAGAPGANLHEVATVFTRANRCLVCNPSRAQMELPSQLQQLQVECGKKPFCVTISQYMPRIVKMTRTFDSFMKHRAHTFREITLQESNSLRTDFLITSLCVKEDEPATTSMSMTRKMVT